MSEKNEELDLAKVQEEQFTEEAAAIKAPEVSKETKDAGKSDMEIVKAARKKAIAISLIVHAIGAVTARIAFYSIAPLISKSCTGSRDIFCAISQQIGVLIGFLLLADIIGIAVGYLVWPKDLEMRVNDPQAKARCSNGGFLGSLIGINIVAEVISIIAIHYFCYYTRIYLGW